MNNGESLFPTDFTVGDENLSVIGSNLLQPSIKAQADLRPIKLKEIATSTPQLASPTMPQENPSWIDEGYKYNEKNEGFRSKLYIDTAAKKPKNLSDMQKDKRWAQDSKGRWGIKTAGSGYTLDSKGNPWDSSLIGKDVITSEEDKARYAKDAIEWDKDMAKRFPELWERASDKNKATLRSFQHNVGDAYFKEGSKSQLYKQMKEGNWNAVSFNVRSWAWARNPDGTFKKDKNGKIISNNPKLESRRARDEEGLVDMN